MGRATPAAAHPATQVASRVVVAKIQVAERRLPASRRGAAEASVQHPIRVQCGQTLRVS